MKLCKNDGVFHLQKIGGIKLDLTSGFSKMVYILAALIIFNIIMWIIMGARFNKFFSTDKFIQDAHDQVNEMITNLNRHADRNITLIDEKIKELKAVSAEAERKVKTLKNELSKVEKSALFEKQMSFFDLPSTNKTSISLDSISEKKENFSYAPKTANLLQELANGNIQDESKKSSKKTKNQTQKILDLEISDDELPLQKAKNSVNKKTEEKESKTELFEQNVNPTSETDLMKKIQAADKALSDAQKQNDNVPKFFVSKSPVKVKKDFSQTVKELHELGFTESQIASQTSKSVQEIKLILEFL